MPESKFRGGLPIHIGAGDLYLLRTYHILVFNMSYF